MRRTVVLLLGLAGVALAEGPLRIAIEPAKPVRLVVEQRQEVLRPARERPCRRKSQVQTFEVQREPGEGDGLDLRVSLLHARVELDGDRGRRVIDTDTPEGRSGPAGLLVGKPITCRLTPRGELLSVEAALGTQVACLPREQRVRLEGIVGDGLLCDGVLGLVTPFPEEVPQVGDTWASRCVVPGCGSGLGDLAIIVTNTVAEVRPDAVVLTQLGALDGESGTVELTTYEGRAVVSREDGLILEGEARTELAFGRGDDRVVARSTTRRSRLDPRD